MGKFEIKRPASKKSQPEPTPDPQKDEVASAVTDKAALIAELEKKLYEIIDEKFDVLSEGLSSKIATKISTSINKGSDPSSEALNKLYKKIDDLAITVKSIKARKTDVDESYLQEISDLKQVLDDMAFIKQDEVDKIYVNSSAISNASEEIKKNAETLSTTAKSLQTMEVKVSLDIDRGRKTYFAWTAVFAVVLLLSAIFITRGFPVNFSDKGLSIAALVVLLVAFSVTCVYNIVLAFCNIDLSKNAIRRIYIVFCGTLVLAALILSTAVLCN